MQPVEDFVTLLEVCEHNTTSSVVRMTFTPNRLTALCSPSLFALFQQYPKHPLCIPSKGRASSGHFFCCISDRIKIVCVEPQDERSYSERLLDECTNYVLLVLPTNDRGVPFARELFLRFMVKLAEKVTISHIFMADDDLESPSRAKVSLKIQIIQLVPIYNFKLPHF